MDKYLLGLTTEEVNEETRNIDECSTFEVVRIINEQDKKVPEAIEKVLPQIAEAVDMLYKSLSEGGRMFYLGAGTSGRLGVLDASECPPTFGTDPALVQGFIAGGDTALRTAVEGCEDSETLGMEQMLACQLTKKDVVVGISASGSANYVIGGMKQAKALGAKTIAVVNNQNTKMEQLADLCIIPIVGAEVINGSTRMKAGTAQKMVLNMLSTATMIKLGKVYGNMMVDLKATNKKLKARAIRMIQYITNVEEETALQYLEKANNDTKAAILMIIKNTSYEEAVTCLTKHKGFLAKAISENAMIKDSLF